MEDLSTTIKYIEEKSGKISKYSDTLRDAVKQIDKALEPTFKEAGIKFEDKKCFYSDETHAYVLLIAKWHGSGDLGIMYKEVDYYNNEFIGDAPRVLVKSAIMRLPQFLADYATMLEETTEEYQESSELAVKLFNMIHS